MSPFTIYLLVYLLASAYCFHALRSLFSKSKFRVVFTIAYVLVIMFTLLCYYKFTTLARGKGLYSSAEIGFYFGRFILMFLTQMILASFLFLQDGSRMMIGLINRAKTFYNTSSYDKYIPSRRKSLTMMATGLTSMFFSGMLYGITKGKYKYLSLIHI